MRRGRVGEMATPARECELRSLAPMGKLGRGQLCAPVALALGGRIGVTCGLSSIA